MHEQERQPSYVTLPVFIFCMTIITAAIGWTFIVTNTTSARVDSATVEMTKIQVQLSQIQTDLTWIKEKLSIK